MSAELERRQVPGVVELRGDDEHRRAGGYAIVYNRYSQNLGGYVEQCAPGLADKSIADGADVLARYQHDSSLLLGRVLASTLRLSADGTGVDYDVDLPDTSYARDLVSLLARGDVRHSSFAFRVMPGGDEWSFTEQGYPLRTLRSVQLVDVAPVVTPAYLDTSSGLRSLAEHRDLDFDTVRKAAQANELGELLRAKDPTHLDLGSGAQGATHARLTKAKRLASLY